MNRDEAIKLLRGGSEGVKKWNEWRRENLPSMIPSLEGADLSEAHLEQANLAGAHLERAKLRGAHLAEATLRKAHLEGADLVGADLDWAILYDANLKGADLRGARIQRVIPRTIDLRGATYDSMPRDDALKLLRGGSEGVKKWNEWRRENLPAMVPILDGADLSKANLKKADLTLVHLERADLSYAHLEGGRLSEAHLAGADLFDAHLEHAWLNGADLTGADLRGAGLEGAHLSEAILERAELHGVRLKGATFREARLEGQDLNTINLEGVDLWRAHLEGAKMCVSQGDSRLGDSVWPFYRIPYILDDTYTRNTEFHPRARDPWSVLRRNYTGPNMVFVLLFTLAAFLPIGAKVTAWSVASRWQEASAPMAFAAVRKTVQFLAKTPAPAWTPWVEKAQSFLSRCESDRMTLPQVLETLELLVSSAEAIEAFRERVSETDAGFNELDQVESWVQQAQEAVRILVPDGEIGLQERRVISLVLGTKDGWHIAILSAVLLLYNVARAFLTYRVGPLRDDEERIAISPAWQEYRPLWRLHQVTSPVLAVSILFGLMRVLNSLGATVLVPI